MSALIALWLFSLYVTPSIIATMRSHPHTASIICINLILGWTLFGWVVALVLAVMPIKEDRNARVR